MDFLELVKNSRSYRSFDGNRPVLREELVKMVECARFAPSAVNRQALKFFLSADEKTNSVIQPYTKWAGKIKHMQLPPAGHMPTAFVVILADTGIAPASSVKTDVGIAAQTILLAAAHMGLGGCMIAAFDPAVHQALKLPSNLEVSLVIALGKPDEEIVLEDAKGNIDYYRDEDNVHHVPKRTLGELIV
ncbi:MAG: nitroreductase family protein [Clostridia bacterium]|nr:nitroreductase family protein [Clostridia bacterium]